MPEKVTLMEGETLDFNWGITATANTGRSQNYTCDVKLFNLIPIKTVDVAVVEKTEVIPSGEAIGVKFYTDGVLVVGISDVKTPRGEVFQPAKDAGISVGDRILSVNGEAVSDTGDFTDKINKDGGKALLEIARGSKRMPVELQAVYSGESDSYKVGLWVRDSTAGIGTLTFYNPETKSFSALGHGICDSDTGDIMAVKSGTVNRCKIRSVIKGEAGFAGELTGDFSGYEIGNITSNTDSGITGDANMVPDFEPVPVASRYEAEKGSAKILCDVDGNGPRGYEVEITRVSTRSKSKNLVIKVRDERLLQKTGGIVQGMSGSPILQNGKLVGAITHVFVNDPTRGYGIFIEEML